MGPRVLLLLSVAALLAPASARSGAQSALPTATEYRQRSAQFRASLDPNVAFLDARGRVALGHRCAADTLTDSERTALAQIAVDRLAGAPPRRDVVTVVPTWFHVVHNGTRGVVSDEAIEAQLRVLNRAFRKHGFRFVLEGITRTQHRKWTARCDRNRLWNRMTRQLSVDAERNLNVYTCEPASDVLGFAYMPGTWSGGPWDSVMVLGSSLPGGAAAPYNHGDTAVHEVGHWLGLFHTFDGHCAPGDLVDDTPAQDRPDYDCDLAADTCSAPGNDPVTNYMNYSDDACMNRFTPGQASRMAEQMAAFRPRI